MRNLHIYIYYMFKNSGSITNRVGNHRELR